MGLKISNTNGGGSATDKANVILKIKNLSVNKKGNLDYENIEPGDEISGELPEGSGRHIVADVQKLPITDDANLEIYSIDYK